MACADRHRPAAVPGFDLGIGACRFFIFVFYFVLKPGEAARVAPLDKLNLALILVAILAAVFPGGRLSLANRPSAFLIVGGAGLVARAT